MKRLLRGNVLGRLWGGSLGLSLGLAVSAASAGEFQWRAAADARPADPPAAAARPGVIASTAGPAAARATGDAVSLGAPVPLPPARLAPAAGLRPVSFSGAEPGTGTTVRAQMGDAALKPMPVGPGPIGFVKNVDGSPPVRPVPAAAADCDCLNCCPGCGGAACDGGACCGNPDGCGRLWSRDPGDCDRQRFWVSAEYLLWWIKGESLPALVTTGSPADAVPGALGQPGTAVLFGNGHVPDDVRSGGRFRAGWWFTDDHALGLEGSFFFLADRTQTFSAASGGSPVLARPFFNPGFAFNGDTGMFVPVSPTEDAQKVAFPDQLAGSVSVVRNSRLWGYEANLRGNLWRSCWCNFDLFGGFRSLGLDEGLQVTEDLASLDPNNPGGFIVRDSFTTTNRFYGAQVGFDATMNWGRWSLDLRTQVALGDVHETVNIAGATLATGPAGTMLGTGGLLAQTSNIGRYSRDRFGVLPEVGLNFGYQVTDWMRLTVGYNFLYLSSVARPGQQIDRTVNPTLLPLAGSTPMGPARPAFAFGDTDFWAQGVTFGMEFRW